ncbi:hypothetical protein BASA50_009897 [Batrachochytrium salamandrivorans]|uniref:Uncharacterized protein n=1 Tax=Batrachochytrium salamandrivorans TaxID=1357716 RepID=A0ABQ8F359_9FUNG|nr:hypothetical protein BASA62_004945 [Batrachochytrium salamandrivorans]KAH6580682.1 hypothetical protein BASA61_009494 [Batrachochytrium salamandrivorans]KAH6583823.1 hypothetical protein BASA60_001240 [Batrachochytrium salamandrivorans]KAH6589640.1 hypothetical protein BASA50_009897 [Batrachochytrium salamandrivorans]KAH9265118.1 hypothetical protein BASA83_011348 [Batrachochytrium salamandrivorans]
MVSSSASRITKAIQLRIYQYELTVGLYMLEPWEKAAFNSIVLVFSAFFIYTCCRWLPSYTAEMVTKSHYYFV